MRTAVSLIAVAIISSLLAAETAEKKNSKQAPATSTSPAKKSAAAKEGTTARKSTPSRPSAITAGKSASSKSASSKSGSRKGSSSTKASAGKKGSKRGRPTQTATWRNRQLAPSPERYSEIQQALVKKGYLQGQPSGQWDQASTDALRRFQREQNLEPSGKIDSLSLIALGLGPKYDSAAATPPPVPPPADKKP